MITSLAISPDNKKIVSVSCDNTVKIWDLESGNLINTLGHGHTDWVNSIAISPDNKKILSGLEDNTIKIWDLESGNLINTLNGHTDYVRSVAISQDNTKIVSGSWDIYEKWLYTKSACRNKIY